MLLTDLRRAGVLATSILIGSAAGAFAQESATDPHHTETAGSETASLSEAVNSAEQDQAAQPSQPGMMTSGMMGSGMMSQGMMAGMMQPGMMEAMPMLQMHGHMTKILFVIADADGDGALSFEEISAIQRRVFDAVDADQSGTVTTKELGSFIQG